MVIPDSRMAEADEDRHAHRYDITPAMLAMDPQWTPSPEANWLYVELCGVYGPDAAFCLWELAGDWHACELASELRARTLRSAA